MKLSHSLLAICSFSLLACDDSTKADPSSNSTPPTEANVAKKKRLSLKEMTALNTEVTTFKKESGYTEPPEVEKLDAEIYEKFLAAQKLKQNHPKILALKEEKETAQAELLKAVEAGDEAGKKKWGAAAAADYGKRAEIWASIPEIGQLQEEKKELMAQKHQIEYDLLAAKPGGQKFADIHKRITDYVMSLEE